MNDLLKLASFYEDASKAINFNDLIINTTGLNHDSFSFLEPYFKDSRGQYPKFPEYINKQNIRIGSYPNREKFIINGRHRLLLSKKYNIQYVPAIYNSYDNDGNQLTEDNILISI